MIGAPVGESFDKAIAVRPMGDGLYGATSYPEWDALFTTHGGVLAAVAISAFEAECNPGAERQIRSLTCHYYRPPAHGEFEILVETMRTGKRMSFARATMTQGGNPFISALAVYSARGLPNMITYQPTPPQAPPPPARDAELVAPEDYRRNGGKWLRYDERAPRFLQQMLGAPQFGDPPFMGPEEVPPEGTQNGGWVTPTQPRRVDAAFLAFCGDLYWPSSFQPLRVPAMAPTLDFTVHFREELPAEGLPDEPVLIHNTTTAALECAADSDSRLYARDGRLLAQARQLQMLAPYDSPPWEVPPT